MALRKAITVFDGTLAADGANNADATLTGRKVRHMRPPYKLSLVTAAVTTIPLSATYILTLEDSADGSTWSHVGTTGTATGAGTVTFLTANQVQEWIRVQADVTAGTWYSGVTLKGTLTGGTGRQ